MQIEILDGIVIGAAGGASAGFLVKLMGWISRIYRECRDKSKVLNWLDKNTDETDGPRFRSSRAIASWNDLTEDRAKYICSIHSKIYLSTGKQADMWSPFQSARKK
ncbi:MAG: hypothetical protein JKX71_01730 [Amylibacter sp.]|nr:hypothetical protein [Amylibacter sp.]